MPIHFYCPLGHRLAVPDERVGKKGRCPVCHQKVYVPVPDPQASGREKAPSPLNAGRNELDQGELDHNDFELDDILSEELGLKKPS